MIVVRVELHSAVTGLVTEIGVMRIANVGGTPARGDYKVRVARRDDKLLAGAVADWGWENPRTREGEVKNYPRLKYNVWRLVSRALRSAFPEEK